MRPPYGEIDVLSPIEGTYQNNNLFYFPEAYERLENIVKTYPIILTYPVGSVYLRGLLPT
jgi:hypothetical protein